MRKKRSFVHPITTVQHPNDTQDEFGNALVFLVGTWIFVDLLSIWRMVPVKSYLLKMYAFNETELVFNWV